MDALAALTAFIPEKGLQLARYYGFYSNKAADNGVGQKPSPAAAAPFSDETPDNDFRRLRGALLLSLFTYWVIIS